MRVVHAIEDRLHRRELSEATLGGEALDIGQGIDNKLGLVAERLSLGEECRHCVVGGHRRRKVVRENELWRKTAGVGPWFSLLPPPLCASVLPHFRSSTAVRCVLLRILILSTLTRISQHIRKDYFNSWSRGKFQRRLGRL
jgi:hypothetical protein